MPHQYTGPKTNGVNLEKCHDTAQHALGQVVEGVDASGRWGRYRYVRFVDAVAYVAGHLCLQASATSWDVSNDRAGGSADVGTYGHHPIGVVFQTTVPTQNQYGWVLIDGLAVVSGTIAAGDYVIPHATVDGTIVVNAYSAAKANFNLCGYALSTTLWHVKVG